MRILITFILFGISFQLLAHQDSDHSSEHNKHISTSQDSSATYLGNEGVMIKHNESSVLFDPFFHNNYKIYQKVPEQIISDIFANKTPFNTIDAIFISHAHGDHFAADTLLAYLLKNPLTHVFAPDQAIEKLKLLEKSQKVMPQITPVELNYGDDPVSYFHKNIQVEALRVPHAGWPNSRTDVSNIVFRVTLNKSLTVIHMGDADPNDVHFKPYHEYWQSKQTDMAFPPYWFFISTYGPYILSQRINTVDAIGLHVPVNVPEDLKNSGKEYFSVPGEKRTIQFKYDPH